MKTILTIMMLAAMSLPAFAQDEMPRRLQIVQADLDGSGELTNVRREDVRLCEDEDTVLTSANLRDITHTDVNQLPGHEANHGMGERYRASCQHGENLYTLVASGPVSARNYIRNTDCTTASRPDTLRHVMDWYDAKGRIVFTESKGLPGVGLPRNSIKGDSSYGLVTRHGSEERISLGWEDIQQLAEGTVTREVSDDTLPGGPVSRTIEYHAPFDRCDRESDYRIAWEEFERRLG